MVLLHVLLIYHIKDVSGINHKLSYNTRSDGKLCTLYLVKNKLSYETTFFLFVEYDSVYVVWRNWKLERKVPDEPKVGQVVVERHYHPICKTVSDTLELKNLCLCAYGETLLARRIIVNNWDQLYFSQYFIRYTYILIWLFDLSNFQIYHALRTHRAEQYTARIDYNKDIYITKCHLIQTPPVPPCIAFKIDKSSNIQKLSLCLVWSQYFMLFF